MDLPTYLPLETAATRYRISPQALTHAAEIGTIRAVEINGGLAVAEHDVQQIAEIRREDYEHLRGQGISLSEASRRYNVPHPTLSRWTKAGHIKKIRREGKALLVDEADVAFAAAVHRAKGARSGQRTFDAAGNPYRIKVPRNRKKVAERS